jgi:hypothetical protein
VRVAGSARRAGEHGDVILAVDLGSSSGAFHNFIWMPVVMVGFIVALIAAGFLGGGLLRRLEARWPQGSLQPRPLLQPIDIR